MNRMRQTVILAGFTAFIAGCGNSVAPSAAPSVDSGKYRLAAEPAGAKDVLEARQEVKDGDEVVVVGRIGGSPKPFVPGRGAFSIVDPSLKGCEEDGCKTPWDYCCTPTDELRSATVQVKFVDEQGKTLAADAKKLFGIQESATVVVKGTARRDDQGNLTILASGLYVRQGQP